MKGSFWTEERKRQACFSSLVGVRSSGRRFSSRKETAPDGKQSETDGTRRVYLIYAGLFLSYSRETKQRNSIAAHLYCKALRTCKSTLSVAGTTTAATANGSLWSQSGGYLTKPEDYIRVIGKVLSIRRKQWEKLYFISDLARLQIQNHF